MVSVASAVTDIVTKLTPYVSYSDRVAKGCKDGRARDGLKRGKKGFKGESLMKKRKKKEGLARSSRTYLGEAQLQLGPPRDAKHA